MFDDLDLDLGASATEVEDNISDLLDFDFVEYVTKAEAVKDIIDSQDPDLVYVSKDEVKWECKSKSEDPKKTDWTGHNDLFWLDEMSVLVAIEQLTKNDKNLMAKIAELAVS